MGKEFSSKRRKNNLSDGNNFSGQEVAERKIDGTGKKVAVITFINWGVTVCFILFAFMYLAVKNGFMLKWYDEMSLFESNSFFFRRFLYYPGGLLRYAGTYLTQLMYYPYLGTAVLIALWILLAWLTRSVFNFKREAYLFTLFVPLVLLVSILHLDEAWLSMKSEGYLFFPTLGYLFTLAAYYIYKQSLKIRGLCFVVIIITLLSYAFAGFFALLAGALIVIDSTIKGIKKIRRGKRETGGSAIGVCINFAESLTALLLGALIPLVYYHYLNGNTVDNDYLYLKGLPELMMEKFDMYLWWPFIISSAIIILSGLINSLNIRKIYASKSSGWAGLAGCLILAVWGVAAEKKSEQLRATVLMLGYIEANEWRNVPYTLSLIKERPNYTMLMLNKLAIRKLGGVEPEIEGVRPGNGIGRKSETFTMTAFVNVPVHYFNGNPNLSYRWAMEHTVQYGKRVFFLKYMVKDALLRGEIKLAKRYNDILLSTMFHRKWAREMNKYIADPSLIPTNKEFSDILGLME